MNELTQHKLFLLGSEKSIHDLSIKSCATILTISDSHGNSDILNSIVNEFGTKSDALVFCGDGTQDFFNILTSLNTPPVVALVHGNCDESSMTIKSKSSDFQQIKVPAAITFNAAGTNIMITHGHIFGVHYGTAGLENHAKDTDASLILYGHTHVADITENNGFTLINPGSCTNPRQGLPPSFALIKLEKNKDPFCTFYEIRVSLSEGIHFIPFNPEMRKW